MITNLANTSITSIIIYSLLAMSRVISADRAGQAARGVDAMQSMQCTFSAMPINIHCLLCLNCQLLQDALPRDMCMSMWQIARNRRACSFSHTSLMFNQSTSMCPARPKFSVLTSSHRRCSLTHARTHTRPEPKQVAAAGGNKAGSQLSRTLSLARSREGLASVLVVSALTSQNCTRIFPLILSPLANSRTRPSLVEFKRAQEAKN